MPDVETMTCRDFVTQSSGSPDHERDTDRQEALRAHLANCPDCRRYTEQTEVIAGWCADLGGWGEASEERVEEVVELSSPQSSLSRSPIAPSSECGLSDSTVRKYLADRLVDSEQVGLLGHLFEDCPNCKAAVADTAFPELVGKRRVFAEFPIPVPSADDRQRVARLVGRLAMGEHPVGQACSDSPDSEDKDAIRLLIEEGRKLIGVRPEVAIVVGRHAESLLGEVPSELQARVLMLLGLALRKARSDFVNADRCFNRALRAIASANAHPVLCAKAMELKAVNLYERSLSREAIAWFKRAEALLAEAGEVVRRGRLLADASGAIADVFGPKNALRQRFRASCLIDYKAAPRYAAAIAHGCSLSYVDVDRPSRGLLFLRLAKKVATPSASSASDQLRMNWAEARLLASCERYRESAQLFELTAEAFSRLDLGDESARVSLEAALAWLRVGERQRAQQLLMYSVPILESRYVGGESVGAIALLRQMIAQDVLDLSLVAAAVRNLSASDSHTSEGSGKTSG